MARISSALDIAQVSDPATPVSGRQFLYFKSDGSAYTKRSDGSIAAFVTTDAAQTIGGSKTFTSNPVVSTSLPSWVLTNGTQTGRTALAQSNGSWHGSAIAGDVVVRGDLVGATGQGVVLAPGPDTVGYVRVAGTGSIAGGTFTATGVLGGSAVTAAGLTGATQASRYVGATTSGPPASGTFVVGDIVVARDGHTFICTTAGTPGTWRDTGLDNVPNFTGTRALTGVSGNTIAIGSLTLATYGPMALRVVLTDNGTSSNSNKVFLFNLSSWMSGSVLNTWYRALAFQSSINPGSGDYYLEIRRNSNATWELRLRDTGTVQTITYVIEIIGPTGITFTPDSTTTTGQAAVTNFFSGTPMTMVEGLIGVLTDSPLYELDVAGTVQGRTSVRGGNITATGMTGTLQGRFVGGTTTGAPTTGVFSTGDYVIARNGAVWVCTAAGSPGTWANTDTTPANMVTTDTNQTTISGQKTFTNGIVSYSGGLPYGAYIQSTNAAHQALIVAANATQTAATQEWWGPSGTAVASVASNGRGTFNGGVVGGSVSATGQAGASAPSRYAGGTASGAPTTSTWAIGDYVIAQNGVVWICTVAGTPGTWVQAAPSNMATTDTTQTITGAKTFSAATTSLVATTSTGNGYAVASALTTDSFAVSTAIATATGTTVHYGLGGFAFNDGNGTTGTNAALSGYYGVSIFTAGAERIRINNNGFTTVRSNMLATGQFTASLDAFITGTAGIDATSNALRAGTRGGIMSYVNDAASTSGTVLTDNLYYDGTNYRQRATSTNLNSTLSVQNGIFTFYNYASVTAGTIATQVQRFRIDATGQGIFGDGSVASAIRLNGATNTTKILDFQTAGVSRWKWQVLGAAETGSNAASDIVLRAFSDTGVQLLDAITVTRATSAITTGASLNTTGNLSENGVRVYSVNNKVPVTGMSATGTPSATTYLRGDNTWATVSGAVDPNTTATSRQFARLFLMGAR